MVICLQMYLESSKVYFKLLSKEDPTFVDLYFVIDNLMKECTEAGLGKVKSAEYISTESEEKMWEEGILGEDTPQQLLDSHLFDRFILCSSR